MSFILNVGGYLNDRAKPYDEGVMFQMMDNTAMLIYFYNQPTKEELDAVQMTKRFALCLDTGVIFFLSKLGNLPWTDAPFTIHLADGLVAPIESVKRGEGMALTVLVVDARDGKICAIQVVGLGTKFTTTFAQMLEFQRECTFDEPRYRAAIQRVWEKSSIEDLVNKSVVEYVSGTTEPTFQGGL